MSLKNMRIQVMIKSIFKRLNCFSTRRRQLACMTAAFILIMMLGLWLIPLPKRVAVDYSTMIYSHDGVLLRPYLAEGDVWRFPVDTQALPPIAVPSLLAREDKRFYEHWGVDPLAIGRAILQAIQSQRVISGGSTITMQLVRLLEPRPRTLWSKLIEAFRAIQLELHLSKAEILELYLSYAPYGGNIEGISAASYVYFGHPISEITAGEMAILLLLPQSPSRWHRYNTADWQQARARVLDELLAKRVISKKQHDEGNVEPVPHQRLAMPMLAPHYTDYLRKKWGDKQRVDSTVAIDVQRMVKKIIKRIQPEYEHVGIHNVSVLVVDNKSRGIRAAVGNFEYLSGQHGQSFTTFDVPRSPGSTLKPFVYALAMTQGKILPQTLLQDVPTQYAGYKPGNFSGKYMGLVTAEYALSQSLNIPFVRMLKDVGVEHFLSYVESGVSWRFDRSRGLGLSVIIGGVELTPLQLAEMYVNLANQGWSSPLHFLAGQTVEQQPWFPEEVVFLLEDTMAKRDRPDFPTRKNFSRFRSDVRWKTGTSQGRRDAWSIGFDSQYTVLVWFGNLDQKPSQFLTGSHAAAPVMFEVLEGLHRQKNVAKVRKHLSAKLEEVEVCAFSGDSPTSACPKTKTVLALKDHPLKKSCRFHKRIRVDKASGLRVFRGCDKGMKTKDVQVLDLPPLVRRWYGERQGGTFTLPAMHPNCISNTTQYGYLSISNPVQDEEYLLLPSFGKHEAIINIDIESSSGYADTACILNGKQLGDLTAFEERLLKLKQGEYVLFCSNAQGGSDEVSFAVKSIH